MFTIITKEIDGLDIVLGVDSEKIDQVATMKNVRPFLENSKEYKAQKTRLEKIRSLTNSNDSLNRQGKTVVQRASLRMGVLLMDVKQTDLTAGEMASINKYNKLRIRNTEEVEAITAELPGVEKKLLAKKKELIKTHGIFFNLKNEYENRIDDTTAKTVKAKLKSKNKKQFLTVDGEIIDDLRGKTFFGKISGAWEKIEVKLLSDTVDTGIYFLQEDLTEFEVLEMNAQFEIDRITALNPEDKLTEKNSMLESALNQSATMKNKLEITGDAKALIKAQEFYNSEKVLIEEKYS